MAAAHSVVSTSLPWAAARMAPMISASDADLSTTPSTPALAAERSSAGCSPEVYTTVPIPASVRRFTFSLGIGRVTEPQIQDHDIQTFVLQLRVRE